VEYNNLFSVESEVERAVPLNTREEGIRNNIMLGFVICTLQKMLLE